VPLAPLVASDIWASSTSQPNIPAHSVQGLFCFCICSHMFILPLLAFISPIPCQINRLCAIQSQSTYPKYSSLVAEMFYHCIFGLISYSYMTLYSYSLTTRKEVRENKVRILDLLDMKRDEEVKIVALNYGEWTLFLLITTACGMARKKEPRRSHWSLRSQKRHLWTSKLSPNCPLGWDNLDVFDCSGWRKLAVSCVHS
jgi:hypothetical protein